MKILVDVNVFIDVLTQRMNWAGSLQVLHLVRKVSEVEGWTSALADAQTAVRGFGLVPLTPAILATAAASALPDFEDNIQLASAELMAVEYLITRNKKDFHPAPVPVLALEEWLALDSVVKFTTDLQE